jgi:predicted TIM-barrel fold metal-dependent hydrolase
MKIIDSHFHIWPTLCGLREGKYILKAEKYGKIRKIGQHVERLLPPSFENTVVSPEVALEYMEMVGVDKAVLLQAPCYGNNNEYLAEVVKKYPNKFVAIALTDPREKDLGITMLDKAINEQNLRGVKFELPDYPFHLDEQKYEPLWEKIVNLDILVVIDMGWGDSEYDFPLDAIKHLISKYEGMKIIFAHLGVSRLWDLKQKEPFPVLQKTMELADLSQNIWFDLAGLPAGTAIYTTEKEEYPYPRIQSIIKVAYDKLGAEKLLWGSDFPTVLCECTYQQSLDIVKKHCTFISEKDKEKILGGNAEKIFFN